MENAVNASTGGSSGQIVVVGPGYAGLHVALRLTARQRKNHSGELTLVDRHDYHQVVTELPRVAGGTRAADAVRIPLQDVLDTWARFVQTEITGFDLTGRRLLTGAGPIGWRRLVLALGSRPNDLRLVRILQVGSEAGVADGRSGAVARVLTSWAGAGAARRRRRTGSSTGVRDAILRAGAA